MKNIFVLHDKKYFLQKKHNFIDMIKKFSLHNEIIF